MTKESIYGKVLRFNSTINQKFGDNISACQKIKIFLDFIIEYKFYGTYLQDYIQYDFYLKKNNARRNYIVFGRLLEIMRICNAPEKRYIFDQKPEFDKVFKNYLKRDFFDVSKGTIEEFKYFISNKESFFAKQPDGMFGTGVEKVLTNKIKDINKLFSKYKENMILCEETLEQCKEFKNFNDTSVNTLRVVTLMDAKGIVHIMGGLLRLGRKGKIADNFHHMGIAAYLDPSGIVSTTGVDKNNRRYIKHPDSDKIIIGFQIPVWDKVCKTVIEAAKVVPEIKYVGWDVVITDSYEIALVEGNPGADPDAEQITTGEGRWPLYYNYLMDIQRNSGRK